MAVVQFEVTAPKRGQIAGDPYASAPKTAVAQIAELDVAIFTDSVRKIVDQMAETFRPREGGPAQTEIEFGLKVTAEGNVVVSKLGGEVSVSVKVTWNRS